MKIGFTGTQLGMTEYQKAHVIATIRALNPTGAIHGDCVGADFDFHNICREFDIVIEIYPPINKSKRAWCKGDIIHEEDDYLVRNKKIVDNSNAMIATPKSNQEETRSGTWSTVRYTRKTGKKIYIINPKK
jgi:hypothetical protein